MQATTTKLIDILTNLTKDGQKARDQMWGINTRYDYGRQVHYVIEHEGYIYDIYKELPYSQNEFYSYKDAERKLREILVKWIKQELEHHRKLHEEFKTDIADGIFADPSPFREEELDYFEKDMNRYAA